MNISHPPRRKALALTAMLLTVLMPHIAWSQPAALVAPHLTPQASERLELAAKDTQLLPWQRQYMHRLAGSGAGAAAGAAQPMTADRALTAPDGTWAELTMDARSGHTAIYDPVRDRMVVFGGSNGPYRNDVWTLSLAGTPTWTTLTPAGTPPSARNAHSAIYDPVRDRMLVFGGVGSSGALNDVWALSLAGAPAWIALTPTGTPPSQREGHSAIYDPVRDRMLVFGGRSSSYLSDVWALSLAGTPAWTLLTPTGTPPGTRYRHSSIYDPVRDRMVIFGGSRGSLFLNDAWALSLADTSAWTSLSPAGTPPSAREGHGAIYDAVRDRMVVFGGSSATSLVNDVWALSLAGTPAWTPQTTSGTPPATRYLHGAIYDPVRDRMVIFGGGGLSGTYLYDAWALSLAGSPAWALMTPTDTPPSARSGHTAIYDPVRDRMVIFGGAIGQPVNDVWTLSLAGTPVWTPLTPTGTPPGGRFNHTAIYDPVRDRMIVFGGSNFSSLGDLWALSLDGTPAWTLLTPTGSPPSARQQHSAIYDPVRDRMVIFGGSGTFSLDEVWALSLGDTLAWTLLTPTGTPPSARGGHSAVYDPVRDRMLVFGGYNGSFLNDLWALSLAGTPAWTPLTPTGTPPSVRTGQSALYDPVLDRMVVFAGSGSTYFNNVLALSLAGTPAWTTLTPSGTLPSARAFNRAIYDPVRYRLVSFSGQGSTLFRDLWALNFVRPAAAGVDPQPALSYLRPAVPNPSRASTTIRYALAQPGHARLCVYDASGRMVRLLLEGQRPAGAGAVTWNGAGDSGGRLAAGVYFVHLSAPGIRETRRVVLLK